MTVSLVMVVVMSTIVATVVVVPVSPIIIAAVRSLIVISIRSIVGAIIVEPEPSVAITKTMTPVASVTVAAIMVTPAVTVAAIMVTPAVTPGDQFYSHAVFRLESV